MLPTQEPEQVSTIQSCDKHETCDFLSPSFTVAAMTLPPTFHRLARYVTLLDTALGNTVHLSQLSVHFYLFMDIHPAFHF